MLPAGDSRMEWTLRFGRTAVPAAGAVRVKDWQPHRIATLFGEVRLKLPRFLCAGCGCGETGVSWPPHCRSTPELNQLQARLSALMPFRVAADVLQHLLPVDAGTSPETLRSHTLQVGLQLADAAAQKPPAATAAITISLDSTFIRSCEDLVCCKRIAMWNQSKIGGFVTPALARTVRRPGQPVGGCEFIDRRP